MDRRTFLSNSALISAGLVVSGRNSLFSLPVENQPFTGLYELFKNPGLKYHPFVRWWWNGDKVEAAELIRELRLLKEAGIGGVEINPIEFPTRSEGDDLGKPSIKWLSNEWIDLLKIVFDEAKSLGVTCDLIVGSGWPFSAEYLEGEERSQIVVIAVKKLTGPLDYEISKFEIFREADPAGSSSAINIENGWSAEFRHCHDGSVNTIQIDKLLDMKDMQDFVNFAGIVVYRNIITLNDQNKLYLNLGKVYGLSELRVNGKDCGVKWHGRRIFRIGEFLKPGVNEIEIKVATTMGNYMKSLTDNPIAQYWTNEKNKIQPIQSMGLIGPITIY